MQWMSLKLRLNLLITVLLAVVTALGVLIAVRSARGDVSAEVESTARLALHLIDSEIVRHARALSEPDHGDPARFEIFQLQRFEPIRHLDLRFYDSTGRLRDSNRRARSDPVSVPPAWFMSLMDAGRFDSQHTTRPVVVDGRSIGELVVTRDPSFEAAEIWSDMIGLIALALGFFVVLNLLIYWAVSRALKPVDNILRALTELERGHLSVRLPDFELPELASIAAKFNAMANTLQQSIERNRRLTQRIVSLQEDERKSLARELHDEIGQCLTAIKVDAVAIQGAASVQAARTSAEAIAGVCRQVMDLIRDMLQRLRPDALDELGLALALRELVDSWRQRQIHASVHVPDDLGRIDEAATIAVYRAAQECLTNVVRHSQANRVSLRVVRQGDVLELTVTDDGQGFIAAATSQGYGLEGMRERVEGLGGSISIQSRPGSGTTVTVRMPCLVEDHL